MIRNSIILLLSLFLCMSVSAQGLINGLFDDGKGSTPTRTLTPAEIERANIEYEAFKAIAADDYERLQEIVSLIPPPAKVDVIQYSEKLEVQPLSTVSARRDLLVAQRKVLQARLVRYLDFIQDTREGNETSMLSKGLSIRRLKDFIKSDFFIFEGVDVSPIARFVTDSYEQAVASSSLSVIGQSQKKTQNDTSLSQMSTSTSDTQMIDWLEVEILAKNHKTFNTAGHSKSKGVNITIPYPDNWKASEGEGPNIVQKFVSDNGSGSSMISILTKDLPIPSDIILTDAEIKEILSVDNLRESVPSGGNLIDVQLCTVGSQPAGIMECTVLSKRTGGTLLVHSIIINLIACNKLVMIQFQCTGQIGSEVQTAQHVQNFRPLFHWIANNIVFNGKQSVSDQSIKPISSQVSSSATFSLLSFLISFLVTWGIGLTPPLLIRYVFVRHPLTPKTASWIAAGCSIFFWMAFRVISSAFELKSGGGTVWIIIFIVARWIMSQQKSRISPKT